MNRKKQTNPELRLKSPKGKSRHNSARSRGRPPKQIDRTSVKKLAALGWDAFLIAEYFGCSQRTIQRRFSKELKGGEVQLRTALRVRQLSLAFRGHAKMLIFMGKQYLGQRDALAHAIEFGGGSVRRVTARMISCEEFEQVMRSLGLSHEKI